MHYGIIQADRKESLMPKPLFFLTSRYDLTFHPGTLDGILREDEHELVVEANGFINALVIVVADLEVFWSEQTTDTLVRCAYT
jgi:hypothetical protein